MAEITNNLEQLLKARFFEKLAYAGAKSPEVRKVAAIAANKKGSAIRQIIAEGIWLNQLVIRHDLDVDFLLVCPDEVRSPEAEHLLFELAQRAGRVLIISARTLESIAETGSSAGIISVCEHRVRGLDDIRPADNSLVLVLDGLEIPGNVGTLVRSADGVDASGVIITNKKTRLTHPKYIRSSQGSCFRVPVVECETAQALSWLAENGFRLLLADTDAHKNYYEEDYCGRVAVVLGSERYGISADYYECGGKYGFASRRADGMPAKIGIPMFGDCDSLNVGIAGTVILYEASLKQKGMIKR